MLLYDDKRTTRRHLAEPNIIQTDVPELGKVNLNRIPVFVY